MTHLWSEGKVSYRGKHHRIDGVSLNVRPVQKPTPPFFIAALSEGSYKAAGELGYPILGIPYASCKNIADLEAKIAAYRETLTSSGHDPKSFDVVQCFHTNVAATDAEAQRNAKQGIAALLAARINVRPRSYDELYKERLVMVGDPKRLIEQIEEIRATGTSYIIFMMNFATLEQKTILASMEIMAKEVLPKFASSAR